MEDNELKQLFEAKRTSEANHRRQAELQRLIAGKPQRKALLWPIWGSAVAAAVVAAIFVAAPLLRPTGQPPIIVAQTPTEPVAPPDVSPSATVAPTIHHRTIRPRVVEQPIEESPSLDTIASFIAEVDTVAPTLDDSIPPHPSDTPPILHRTSTLLACTEGCVIPPEYDDHPTNRKLIVNGNADMSSYLAVYTIER